MKFCFYLFIVFNFFSAFFANNAVAELSYNFTKKEFTNGMTEENRQTLVDDNKEKYYYNFNANANADTEKKEKIQPTGDKNTELKLTIGGLAEFQYFYVRQPSEYRSSILPNGMPSSPQSLHNYSIANDDVNIFNMLGRIDITPEFKFYGKPQDDVDGKRKELLTIGAKLSQPFYNASKNTDPRLAPKEYIYLKTKFFTFDLGAAESSASRMRVDAEKIASGAGGVYGMWWRYVSLPVFNTAGISGSDLSALNAMSPIYILYPTLPNEAGFTAPRSLVGQQFAPSLFANGNIATHNLLYGANAQFYPTQGAYSNKISVYLKRVKGFSFGVSYSPTTANTGFITKDLNKGTSLYANTSGGEVRNYVSVGVDYRKQFDKYGLGVALSATYEYGEPNGIIYFYNRDNGAYGMVSASSSPYYQRYKLNAFSIGAKVVYKNYSFAYSYGYWGKSLLNKYAVLENGSYQLANQGRNSYYHTAGIGANYGPIRVGCSYMRSSFAGYKLDAWSIGTDFKMLSLKFLRVQPYFEYLGYIFHTKEIQLKVGDANTYKASASRGYVLTAGIRVVF